MIEAIVASLLNKYLGKYVKDLDSENISVGIFSGKAELIDLKLRPEALVELGLPVEIKAGSIGKICIDIPWTGLYSQPLVVVIEDVFALAGPILERPYNEDQERQLQRASKQRTLESLENPDSLLLDNDDMNRGFFEKLTATVINNVQVSIRNVHIRYEDTITNPECPIACGIAIHGLSAETTNSRWKPAQVDASAPCIYKLIKLESMSMYWNPFSDYNNLTGNQLLTNNWKNTMKKGLATFSVNEEDFEFIVKPISAKVKVILNRSNEAKVPKLLLDFVLQDVASQLTRQQYLSVINLLESFQRMQVNQRYRKYHPGVSLKTHARQWWLYAYMSVLEESIRPYSWVRIEKHRKRYREYKTLFKERLRNPGNTELKVDLQKLEDNFDLINIVMAREQARLEFAKEDPARVQPKKPTQGWWSSWFTGTQDNSDDDELEITGEHDKQIWSQLTPEDKQKIYDAIGYKEGEIYSEKPKQYIEHKLNFTFANCTLSLVNYDKEILVVTLTQLLLSVDTRPSAHAFRLSARTESFIIEGASVEHDLVPVISADHAISGNTVPHVFALDFEKNPLHVNADYGINVQSEPVEIVYHEHAISEVLTFLQVPATTFEDIKSAATSKLNELVEISRAAVEYAIATRQKIHINVDVKSPYFIIPEHGTTQKSGSIVVVDLGHLAMKSELQTDNRLLEDATRTELEERLYDRIQINVSEVQVLFADSVNYQHFDSPSRPRLKFSFKNKGDEWRVARTLSESESHLIPKLRLQVIFSNSVKPDYRQMPRQKLNVTIPTLKLNLSDRRVRLLSEFILNLPMPSAKVYRMTELDCVDGGDVETLPEEMKLAEVILEPKLTELRHVRHAIRSICSKRDADETNAAPSNEASQLASEAYYSASDHSDEEQEQWARVVDLPGFDDNVSPSNAIITLLRFLIGEVVVQLARSSDHADKPYLMLRVDKLCADVALMECGPALQASLGGIQLVDKLHTGSSGEYLELISSRNNSDIITILYRKVRSDCPDFKTYFHSVEQSVVFDFTTLHLTFHRGAFLTLSKFLEYTVQRIGGKDATLKPSIPMNADQAHQFLSDERDPPVPPGATKFSISARLDEIKVKLCDSDLDFASVRIAGLECDFVLKANEKMILRAQLTDLSIEDLSEMTLFTKILTIEDDKVFDFKYIRHSVNHHKQQDVDGSKDVNDDGTLRLRVGKAQITYLHKFLGDMQKFVEPFIQPQMTTNAIKSVEKEFHRQVEDMTNHGTRLNIAIDILSPTIMVPQKSHSPNVLVFKLGNLSIENFFHEVTPAGSESKHIVDNLLIRLDSVQMSRAVIVLGGSLEIQEPILEPMKLRLDLKRALAPFHRDVLLYEIQGNLDTVKLNISQRDLGLFVAIYKENFTEGQFTESNTNSHPATPSDMVGTPITTTEDPTKKLQAFLTTSSAVHKEMSISFTLEGMHVTLYSDLEEVLSPSHLKPSNELSRFEMDEVSLLMETYHNKSVKFKCALQAVTLEDTRADTHLAVRKIFQSYSGERKTGMGMISLSMPPMIDFVYKRSQDGDMEVDVMIEKTRLNVSVPYILAIMRFLYDAIPTEKPPEGGIINPGFTTEFSHHRELLGTNVKRRREASISDSTSGYHSTSSTGDDLPALNITAKLKKPEIVLFADPTNKNSRVLVIKADMNFDYHRIVGQDTTSASIDGLQILSCVYGRRKQTAYMVLQPCDAEFSQVVKTNEEGTKTKAVLTPVDLRLSASTVHTVTDIVGELTASLKPDDNEGELIKINDAKDAENLWVPKKILPHKWNNNAEDEESYVRPSYPQDKPHETCIVNIPIVQVTCELEDLYERIPVLLFKTMVEAEINNWSTQMYMKAESRLEILYYNEKISVWEPLLEPVMQVENNYWPWEVLLKVYRHRSLPIAFHNADDSVLMADTVCGDSKSVKSQGLSGSESSDEESESENGMTIIKRASTGRRRIYAQKSYDSGSLVGYPVDSDSENEEGVLDKIASAFGHMFSRDVRPSGGKKVTFNILSESSEGEPSESEEENANEAKSDGEDETDTADPEVSVASGEEEGPVFLRKEGERAEDSEDSGVEDVTEHMATYIILDARDRLEITLTPVAMSIIKDISDAFTKKSAQTHHSVYRTKEASFQLHNRIGPQANIIIVEKSENAQPEEDRIVKVASDEEVDQAVSPASTALLVDISPPDSDVEGEGEEVDRFSISSALNQVGNTSINFESQKYEEEDVSVIYQATTKRRIIIEVDGFDKLQCLMPTTAGCHLYALQPQKNDTRYHVVVDVEVHHGQKTVTVRSPLQVRNHTSHPISLFYKKASLEAFGLPHPVQPKNPFEENICLGTLSPDEVYPVPLFVAYHCKLFVQPTFMNYLISNSGMWWQELSAGQNHGRNMQCASNDETQANFHVRVLCADGPKLKLPVTGSRAIPNYIMHLYPPLVVHNQLPYEIELKFMNSTQDSKLDPGSKNAVYNADLNKGQQIKLEVLSYLGIPWNGSLDLSADMDDHKSMTMVTEYDTGDGNKQLSLSCHVERECGLDLYLYAPYWIVNKTGLPLQFRGSGSDMVYQTQLSEEPLLFRFKRHRRKKAKVRVYNSRWSASFSLDAVGSNGVVMCKDKEREKKYQFLLNITLSKMQLTKIITLMPFFMVVNNTPHPLRYMEENEKADLWLDIGPLQCVSFWPDTNSLKMYVKHRDSNKVSQHFPFSYEHSTVLRMDNGTAICVDVHGGLDTPMTVTLYSYTNGDSPVRIDNMCEDLFLKIYQKSLGQVMLLSPYQSLLYTWDDPTMERTLFWNVYNRNKPGIPAFFNKDGSGHERVSFHTLRPSPNAVRTSTGTQSSSDDDDSENGDQSKYPLSKKTRKDKVVVYWVSYMDAQQRVLLFTQDERVAKQAKKAIDAERSTLDCCISLHNIGLSLVNSDYLEVAYFSLASMPAVWKVEINGRWKMLTVELSTWLEDKWRAEQSVAHLKDYIQVDFSKMQMTKPFFGQLRREYSPAVWCHYRQSQHQYYVCFRLHRFQIDNQLPDAVFPTVLHPTPIPSYVVKKTGPKPCLELLLIQRDVPELNSNTTKYLKVLVQEFNLKIDKGFVLSVYDVFSTLFTPQAEDDGLRADLTSIHTSLRTGPLKPTSSRPQRAIFEFVHLCPAKLHFSFSPRGTVHRSNPDPRTWRGDILNFFLNSIGATLTEVKDIELKTAYYERKGIVMSPSQLIADVQSHYTTQFVQQMYVLILGLDVLGNPYGLVKDFTQGLGDFFYEPFMGSIKGPEEFAEGISVGVRSLLGHVVGSTAGSVSLITGSLGHALATLSFDEDYRRKRRQRLLAQHTLPETMLVAGRSFVLGVVLGLSGVFVKPVIGCQLEGVEGFFKGIGKGLSGLLTKPAGGMVDMVSMAFDGVRRAAEMGENVVMRNRLPRYLNPHQGIKPFSPYMATGARLLVHLSKGHYSESDTYFAHAALKKEDRSDVALITDRHVFLLEKCRFWGGWDIEWMVRIDDIMAVPKVVGKNLVIKVRQDESFNLYSGDERLIPSEDIIVLKWIGDKIEKCLVYNMADKPLPENH